MKDEGVPGRTKQDRRRAAREHAATMRLAERRRQRRQRVLGWSVASVAAAIVLAAALLVVPTLIGGAAATTAGGDVPTTDSGATGGLGPEGMAVETGAQLAPNTTASTGATRDGIACSSAEGSVEHIHTHLAVYVDGLLRPIPIGIGVVEPAVQDPDTADAFAQATKCYYWLHVHAADGVIHVEAPAKDTYTLGQLFAVWQQPLSSSSVAGATGEQTVFIDGRVTTQDPATIPLGAHEDIQIDVGQKVPFKKVDWSSSEL